MVNICVLGKMRIAALISIENLLFQHSSTVLKFLTFILEDFLPGIEKDTTTEDEYTTTTSENPNDSDYDPEKDFDYDPNNSD